MKTHTIKLNIKQHFYGLLISIHSLKLLRLTKFTLMAVILLSVSCRKTSNELRPNQATPILKSTKAYFENNEFYYVEAKNYKSSNRDTTDIEIKLMVEKPTEGTINSSIALLFYNDEGRDIDKIQTKTFEVNDRDLFGASMQFELFVNSTIEAEITSIANDSKIYTQFQYSGNYLSGNCILSKDNIKYTGKCRSIISADGSYRIWFDIESKGKYFSKGKFNLPSGGMVNGSIQKSDEDAQINIKLEPLPNTNDNYFIEQNNSLKFSFLPNTANDEFDSVEVSLFNRQ